MFVCRFTTCHVLSQTHAQVSVFRSGSLQRPNSKTFVPGPQRYSPNPNANRPSPKNMGTGMKGNQGRFDDMRFRSSTEQVVGPGTYEPYGDEIVERAEKALQRYSKIRPGFGTTSPQRKLPFYAQGTPAPGNYDPMEPRLKDLSGEARRQVM
jgi:hypothetical protein